MKKHQLTILFLFSIIFLFGQSSSDKAAHTIGIAYYRDLGFRRGIAVDFGINLRNTQKEKKSSILERQLNFRPALTYYRYPHFSNNFSAALKLNYQFKFINPKKDRHVFIEPFIKVGYLRYFFAGEVFETTNNGFEEVPFGGSNSLIFGGAFDLGGSLSKKVDWLVGFDYFAESTEDQLILHRFAIKLGTRIKINTKTKTK